MADKNAELFTLLYSKLALAMGVTPSDAASDPELEALLGGPPPRPRGLRPAAAAGSDAPAVSAGHLQPRPVRPCEHDLRH